MHNQGFSFYSRGLGIGTCSLDAGFVFSTVCNRRQPFRYGRASGECYKKWSLFGRNTFASFSEDDSHFPWQAQYFRHVALRVFCESRCQGCVEWWRRANSVAHFTHYLLALHTLHFTHHTVHSRLHRQQSTLHTWHFTLHTLNLALHTWRLTLYSLHCTLHALTLTLHSLHFTLQDLHFTLHTLNFTFFYLTLHTFLLYALNSTLYTSYFTLHFLHSTLLNHSVYTPHLTL